MINMNLEFNIDNLNKEEKDIIPEFCNMLTESIQNDIRNNIRYSKINSREEDILSLNWINWIRKPKSYNMVKLGYLIVESITCKHIEKNLYSIAINRKVYMPLTRTKLSRVARFLDRGNESTPPINFISPIFAKYRKNINKYWKAFVSVKLKIIDTKEIITIK